MNRKKIIVANWKMQLSHKAAIEELLALKKMLKAVVVTSDIILCPSFPALQALAEQLGNGEKLQLGAQDVHWEERGAWTGQVSVLQIAPFVKWCIVGHSEVRAITRETDATVEEKVHLLLKHGINPIVCIGEDEQEKASGKTDERITQQVKALLTPLTRSSLSRLVIAYEPVWAISSNTPAAIPDPADMAGVMLLVRKLVAEHFDVEAAERLRIIYGGSVDHKNAPAFFNEPGIDGALVGSASLRPVHFREIIMAAQSAN